MLLREAGAVLYYKIIYDGVVIDVQNGLDYVTQSPTTQGIIGSDTETGAYGIVSSDGSEIWQLSSLPQFPSGNYRTVTAVEITKDEYDELRTELDAGNEVSYDAPEQSENIGAGRTNLVELMTAAQDAISVIDSLLLAILEG